MTSSETTPSYPSDAMRYAGYFVYRRVSAPTINASAVHAEMTEFVGDLAAQDVVTRGIYDVSAMRADADLMLWLHAPTAEALQAAFRRFRSSATGRGLAPTWSAVGLHRESEFNKTHVPAFIDGRPARRWVAVYPYLRSYEWYLLPDTERAALLGEHGKLGRDYPAVQNNTIAAFALNDYEWLLAVESDELDQIVDLMRHLRSSATRRHVRLETPFFTGRRIDAAGVAEVLA
ncbi:MAG: chlorite dismutase [Actinobacteria bacterium 69-20]|nr:chlorite dismutase family protein [Actinomycetota bacterium]OJV29596.1 MAG: chlorite dismutase [Actinobacteria bacterium 69-20]